MSHESRTTQPRLAKALEQLVQLRGYTGPPKDFWPRYLEAMQQLTAADHGVLLVRNPDQPWRRILDWPVDSTPSRMLTAFFTHLNEVADRAAREGGLMVPLEAKAGPAAGNFVVACRLDLSQAQKEECVVAALLSEMNEPDAREALLRLRLAGHAPESYQLNLATRQARADVEKFAAALDLALAVNVEKHFLAAALAFCNGVATRFNGDRVSLGWLEGGYIRLRAISRTEKFDRQMAAARALEVAMEEALDQDEEVVWPPPEGATAVSRDHQQFAEDQKIGHVGSLPLRTDKKPVAVVTCERQGAPFSLTELQQLRLACDLVTPRLADLQRRDRWFGARWATTAREQCARLIGPEHTWAKLLALLVAVLLGLLFFLRVPYRVEGNFLLRSDELAHLTAPFDGYIDQVLVRPGDAISEGAPLLRLKTSELELEESFALADLNRYQREAEKARAARSLAEMRISEAMSDQARARLEMVRYRISQAVIKAPFAGVIVEGDPRERLGAPVKAADVLFRLARIDTLYVEAEVNERDVHEILGRSTGDIAFVSQPKRKYPVHITTVEPAAVPKNEANVFLVRCAVESGPQPWWRPGMSGVCKFNVEKRTLFWILTHRTVDFLRLKLWW